MKIRARLRAARYRPRFRDERARSDVRAELSAVMIEATE